MTPEQCKAARALIHATQATLALWAGVGVSTVADFERGARQPIPATLAAMRTALERCGIVFEAGGARYSQEAFDAYQAGLRAGRAGQ